MLANSILGELETRDIHTFRCEALLSTANLDLDDRLIILGDDLVGEVLDIGLDILLGHALDHADCKIGGCHLCERKTYLLRELAPNKTLDIEDCAERVCRSLVLCGVSD